MKSRPSIAPHIFRDVSPNFDLDLDSELDDMFEYYDSDSDLVDEIRRRRTRRSPRAAPRASGPGRSSLRPQRRPPARRRHPGKRPPRPLRRPRSQPRRPRFSSHRRRRPVIIPQPASPCICPAQGSELVRWVQITLNQRYGLQLQVDGIAKASTRKAISRFQREKGLPVDGIAGPDTERALIEARSSAPSSVAEPVQSEISYSEQRGRNWIQRRGSRNHTLWVQRALNSIMGLRLALDGILGPATRNAIRSFQRRYGLAVDGVVGPRTEAKLINLGADNGQSPSRRTIDSSPPTERSPHSPPPTDTVLVTLGTNARVSDNAISVLKAILRDAGLAHAMITSGRRTSADQARIMYDLITRHGVSYAKNLYGRYGDQVIDVYRAQKGSGRSPTAIKQAMETKIKALGCHYVSHHCSDEYDVFDVGPRSIANTDAFRGALKRALERGFIDNYITPPDDPAFHIEIKLKPTSGGV